MKTAPKVALGAVGVIAAGAIGIAVLTSSAATSATGPVDPYWVHGMKQHQVHTPADWMLVDNKGKLMVNAKGEAFTIKADAPAPPMKPPVTTVDGKTKTTPELKLVNPGLIQP